MRAFDIDRKEKLVDKKKHKTIRKWEENKRKKRKMKIKVTEKKEPNPQPKSREHEKMYDVRKGTEDVYTYLLTDGLRQTKSRN